VSSAQLLIASSKLSTAPMHRANAIQADTIKQRLKPSTEEVLKRKIHSGLQLSDG
jgi:hypothetical protein